MNGVGIVGRRPGTAVGRGATLRRRQARLLVATGAVLAGLVATGGFLVIGGAGSGTRPVGAEAGDRLACPRGVTCSRIRVPLDWNGSGGRQVSLWVEVQRPSEAARGVIFLLAGGPGQAATGAFGLGIDDLWQTVFPGYTLVTFDARGTGESDPPSCEAAETTSECAQALGPDRRFYTTAANVRDLEAVRQALGFHRIGLFGVSYGTELALDYARRFRHRVRWLVLDSPSQSTGGLPALSGVLRALPAKLHSFCARVCPGTTRNYGRNVIALANSLSTDPLRAPVLLPDGRTGLAALDAVQFIDLVSDSDLNPWLAAVLPAAVQAARLGDPQPLLRLTEIDQTPRQPPRESVVNEAVYTATVCNDGPFPWPAGAALGQRLTSLTRAMARLPAGAFGGLGRWAVELGDAYLCLTWPGRPAAEPTPGSEPFPDVPVLAIAGAFDLRATTAEARDVLRHFREGRLLRVLDAGHGAVTNPVSGCVLTAIRRWLGGGSIPASCTAPRVATPIAPYPLPARASAEVVGTPVSTLALAEATLREAEAMWQLLPLEGHDVTVVAGLAAGRLTASTDAFGLAGYGISRAVSLSGVLRLEPTARNGPEALRGSVALRGPAGSLGTLKVDGAAIDGIVAGRPVQAGKLVPTLKRR
jgi:pimeloyl-ACP methyl ester carboxylesterase